jgi:hypothetical protein
MSVEQLKNGSKYDSYAVDDVVRKLDALMDQGLGGNMLLVDLHRLATDHPKAGKVTDQQKQKLQEAGLLGADGKPSQIVRDVIASTTTGEGMSLVFTPKPYAQERTPAERAGMDPNNPLAAMLNKLSLKQKPGGRED